MTNFSVSTSLFIKNWSVFNVHFSLNIFLMVFGLCQIIYVIVIYGITDYIYCGEFKYNFKWNKLALNYYYIQMFIKFISAIILAILNKSFYSFVIIAVLFFIAAIVTAACRPYSNNPHTARSAINLIICSIIFGLFCMMKAN